MNIRTSSLAAADGFLLVYSIYSRPSFNELTSYHSEIQHAKGSEPFHALIIGNHCDRTAVRRVTYEEGRELSRQLGSDFVELYPNSPRDTSEAFFRLIREFTVQDNSEDVQRSATMPSIFVTDGEGDAMTPIATQDTGPALGRSRSLRDSLRERLSPDAVKHIVVRRRSFQDGSSHRRERSLIHR